MAAKRTKTQSVIFRECIYNENNIYKLDEIRQQYHIQNDNVQNIQFWEHCLIHNGRDFVNDQIKKEFLYWLTTPNNINNNNKAQCTVFCLMILTENIIPRGPNIAFF